MLHRHVELALVLAALCAAPARADEPPVFNPDGSTLFFHPDDSLAWISGQLNVISQAHPAFGAQYSGPNSLSAKPEGRTSFVGTLYVGLRATETTEVLLDLESAGGAGLSNALGLGGFSNLDVVRNPELGFSPYVARAMVRQIIPLSSSSSDARPDPLHLSPRLPVRRLELSVGKLSTVDFFDTNTYGSDSHLQFMNWTVDANGAFDFAADTRGYTLGAVLAYQQEAFGVLFGEVMMPKVANGPDYDFDLAHAHAENLEVDVRHHLAGRAGTVRLLAYANHADMGSYREAIDAFESGADPEPSIAAHRAKGRVKPGVGVNFEQELGGPVAAFGRAGWADGRYESFAFTEVEDSVELGVHLDGAAWRRPRDSTAIAAVSNGLSDDHREYLRLGGSGFILGDGGLRYGREQLVEAYYTAFIAHGLFGAVDLQVVDHPGYNRDRGPVWIGGLRLHAEL